MEISVNDSAAQHQNRLMADLTQAMRSAADASRQADFEKCQNDAKTYIEQLRARTLEDSEVLRQASEADVATIRERARARVERVRQETEQRILRRRQLLEQELTEFHADVEAEIGSVQERIESFQTEVSQFFEQLLQGSADPTVFATMASKMPDPPVFADLDRESFAAELRERRERAERAARGEPLETAAAPAPEAPPMEAPPTAGSNGQKPEEPRGRWWRESATGAARTQAEEHR